MGFQPALPFQRAAPGNVRFENDSCSVSLVPGDACLFNKLVFF